MNNEEEKKIDEVPVEAPVEVPADEQEAGGTDAPAVDSEEVKSE